MPRTDIRSVGSCAILNGLYRACARVLLGVIAGCGPDELPKLKVELPISVGSQTEPPELNSLQELAAEIDESQIAPVLLEALRDSALTLGAQGGLARRAFEINEMLKKHELTLDKIYQFDRVSISAPNGSIVMPPVISETRDDYKVSPDGQIAASADTVYRIARPGRIVTTSPNWRDYLRRTWKTPELPPAELLPKTAEEREIWRRFTAEGWKQGLTQGESIFNADLSRLERDMAGMVRYRSLVAQGILNEMYFAAADRGVTGGGDEMKVGDKVVRITIPARLNESSDSWTPVVVGQRP